MKETVSLAALADPLAEAEALADALAVAEALEDALTEAEAVELDDELDEQPANPAISAAAAAPVLTCMNWRLEIPSVLDILFSFSITASASSKCPLHFDEASYTQIIRV